MAEKRVSIRRINIIVGVLFLVILGVSAGLQISMNKKNAYISCDITMDRSEDVIKYYGGEGKGIEDFLDKMPYTDIITTYILEDTGDDSFIPAKKQQGKRYYGVTDIDDTKSYLVSEVCGGYRIGVTYPVNKANANIVTMTVILLTALLCAFVIINVVVDRTFNALEKSREEAERANAAKTSFLSRMSHDIRTPLNGILGLLQIDAAHEDDKELVKANREKITVAANHLLALINDVLQMSKLEDGRIELAHEAFDLKNLAKDVLTITDMRAAESGLTLNYENPKEVFPYPYVYGSPVHLRQLFVNIYSNSIKYNKLGGSITTDVHMISRENDIVTYQWVISDTGIGMSKEFVEHIFEAFAQEHSDARSIYKGTGLGMAIVKSLVEAMHGTIEVSSVENEGTSFMITLPFEIAEKDAVFEKKEQAEDADITGKNLLLAEDNDLNAEIAQVQLEEAGANITRVEDGKQAVEMFAENPEGTFDAVLMDIMMPVMDGLAATRAIRVLDRPDAGKIPIIAMSANAFDEDAKKSIEAGMNAHLAKPLKIEDIIAVIAKYCNDPSGEV